MASTGPVPSSELEGSRKERSAGEAHAVCKSQGGMTWRWQMSDCPGRGTLVTFAKKTGACYQRAVPVQKMDFHNIER